MPRVICITRSKRRPPHTGDTAVDEGKVDVLAPEVTRVESPPPVVPTRHIDIVSGQGMLPKMQGDNQPLRQRERVARQRGPRVYECLSEPLLAFIPQGRIHFLRVLPQPHWLGHPLPGRVVPHKEGRRSLRQAWSGHRVQSPVLI